VSPELPMPKRTAKFVSAVFAGILAGIPVTTISRGETVAADNCLSAPKGETPAGSHWYYRIEHSTKRHCWYLRGDGERLSQAPPQNILPPPKPPPSQADPAPQRSIADAHAELPARANGDDAPTTAWPTPAVGLSGVPRAGAAEANIASTVVASRWPEPSGASPVPSPRPATSNMTANASAISAAPPAPAVAAVTLAAADSPSLNRRGSNPTWLVTVVGALALASVAGVLISRFGHARQLRRPPVRTRRGPVWETTDDDRIVLSDHPGVDGFPRQAHFFHGAGEASEPNDRGTEFYSRRSSRAPT
jgi:hypothetical protein